MTYAPQIIPNGANLASVAALPVPGPGYFQVTGTTTITTLATQPRGVVVALEFAGILTFTHGATLILKSNSNVTTGAGNIITLVSEGGGTWREFSRNF